MGLLRLVLPALLPIQPAVLHGPPVNIEVDIEEGRISVAVQAEQWTANPWIGVLPDRMLAAPLPEEKVEPYMQGAREFFDSTNQFTVDGERVVPEVAGVRLLPAYDGLNEPPMLEFELNLPCDGFPRSVGILWEAWERTEGIDGRRIVLLVAWPGDFAFGSLRPEEPQHVWHAPPDMGEERAAPAVVGREPEPELPLISVLIGAGLVLSIPVVRKLRPPLPLVLLLWVGGGAAAWTLRERRIFAPWSGVSLPQRDEALAMFETLHGNIYYAFASRNEDDVYELLSRSVAPGILDELYGEVYESMILRAEGGAVADVEKVEVLARDVHLPEEEPERGATPSFDVDWKWQVHGLVSHFGHRHSRTNQYHARYTVAHDGESWKIADVEILDHKRLEDYGGGF